jgi:hypothetical protein
LNVRQAEKSDEVSSSCSETLNIHIDRIESWCREDPNRDIDRRGGMNSSDHTAIEEQDEIEVTDSELWNSIILSEELEISSLRISVVDNSKEMLHSKSFKRFDEEEDLILWEGAEDLFQERLDGEEGGEGCQGIERERLGGVVVEHTDHMKPNEVTASQQSDEME